MSRLALHRPLDGARSAALARVPAAAVAALTSLDLRACHFAGAAAGAAVAALAARPPLLRELRLGWLAENDDELEVGSNRDPGLDAAALAAFAPGCVRLTALQTLVLGSNYTPLGLTERVADALIAGLCALPAAAHLNIAGCDLQPRAMLLFADALRGGACAELHVLAFGELSDRRSLAAALALAGQRPGLTVQAWGEPEHVPLFT